MTQPDKDAPLAQKTKRHPKVPTPPKKTKPWPSKEEIAIFPNPPSQGAVFLAGFDLLSPIKSEANSTDHWTVKRKRQNAQKIEVIAAMSHLPTATIAKHQLLICITRIGGRRMDDDNYQNAVKAIRDAIADQLRPGLAPGQADSTDQFVWSYHQQKGSPKRIRIEFWKRITI